MGQEHTEYVLNEYGSDVALAFHLTSRVFPPAPYMTEACKAAITAVNDGNNKDEIDLPEGMTFQGGRTAPASAIVTAWRLEAFLTEDEDDEPDGQLGRIIRLKGKEIDMYKTFTRTWWRPNPEWPNGLEPHAGRRTYHDSYKTEAEAQRACRAWNAGHKPGRLSRKMEYEES